MSSTGIAAWLDAHGLGKYTERFVEQEIDVDLLTHLTDADLDALGLPIGPKRRLKVAIAALAAKDAAATDAAATRPPMASAPATNAPSNVSAPERRQLTIMFADLAGSTAMSTSLDMEQLRDITRAYQDAAAAAITRFGGYVARYMGDGVLAYFGYPQAFEDAAERAVQAGLHLTESIPELSDVQPLAVRIGIATGPVVVGDLIGEGASREHAVVGETPNLAARLQALAAPNSVVVSAATARLLSGRVAMESLGAHNLKGFAQAVEAFRARYVNSRTRFEASLLKGTVPLVGREAELDSLRALWAQAQTAQGRVALVAGEPGIGKSRIVQALVEHVGPAHVAVRCQCSPYYVNSAFHPFVSELAEAAALSRTDSHDTQLDKLDVLLVHEVAPPPGAAPVLAELLSLPTQRYAGQALDAEERKLATINALVYLLMRSAGSEPILAIVEDAHWMDPSSLAVLDAAVNAIKHSRVMIVVTHRPQFLNRWPEAPHVETLELGRLHGSHGALLVDLVSDEEAVPANITTRIVERADGVPLFIEELTRNVVESSDGTNLEQLSEAALALAIPASLQDSLLARLDRLASARDVVQVAAAIGRRFSLPLLRALCLDQASDLERALLALQQADLIYPEPASPNTAEHNTDAGDAERRFVFKHALVQEAAYSTLLHSARAELHGRIARTLAEQFSDIATVTPEVVAQHYQLASNFDEAANFWQRAGRRAWQGSAYREAIAHFDAARQIMAKVSSKLSDEFAFAIECERAHALLATDGQVAQSTGEAYQAARGLAAKLNDPPHVLPVLRGLFNYHLGRGNLVEAHNAAEELLSLGHQHGDSNALAFANALLGMSFTMAGDLTRAHTSLRLALTHYSELDAERAVRDYGHDAKVAALQWLGVCGCLSGSIGEGRAAAAAGVAHAKFLGVAYSTAMALGFAARVEALLRNWAQVGEYARELGHLASTRNMTQHHGLAQSYQALARFELARFALARRNQPLPRVPDSGPTLRWMAAHVVEAQVELGRYDVASTIVDQALAASQKTGMCYQDAEMHRLRGLIALRRDQDLDGARRHWQAGIDAADAIGARWWLLRILSDWLAADDVGAIRERLQVVLASMAAEPDVTDYARACHLMAS